MIRHLQNAKRAVVKIGSSLLVDPSRGHLRRTWLAGLAEDIAASHARGCEVLVVSSGAIALGRRHLGAARGALKLEISQAAAACGQIRLARAYEEALTPYGIRVAQVLLTLEDTESRRRYLNARATINTLLRLRTVPVINENDTVATSEIRYGDNDRLAARVAQMMAADCLLLLSDVRGLHTADPRRDAGARLIPEVSEITPEIERMAGRTGSDYGSGGMVTKIAAAKIALDAGCHVVISDGTVHRPLGALDAGADATWFTARANPRTARKQWIAASLKPAGALDPRCRRRGRLGRRQESPAGRRHRSYRRFPAR